MARKPTSLSWRPFTWRAENKSTWAIIFPIAVYAEKSRLEKSGPRDPQGDRHDSRPCPTKRSCRSARYKAYQVYVPGKGYVWAENGMALEGQYMSTSVTWAVRIMAVNNGLAIGINGQGQQETVPVHAIGAQIPDVAYLPGVRVWVSKHAPESGLPRAYCVRKAAETEGNVREVYEIQALPVRNGSRSQLIRLASGEWLMGVNQQKVQVWAQR